MDKRSYVGQLYRGEPQTKSWSQVVSGHVTIRLVEGEGTPGEWKLAAYRKEKVWECKLNPGIKFRVKNDFVQWQTKGGGGETVTYGIRLKDQEAAAQLSDKIGEVLNALLSKAPEGDEVQVRVLCSVRDPSLLTVRSSTTMLQLLRMYCHKKQMDSSQFIIALPPDSPHPPVKPSTIVASLKTKEVQVIKKGPKPPSSAPPPAPPTTTPPTESTDGSGLGPFEQLLQVELPRDERTVVRVSSLMTIAELLKYICEKRNLDVADHRFDLPATEESLAGKTLEQLKIKTIRVVLREGAKRREEQPSPVIETRSPSRSKRKSTKRNALDTGNESPKFNRRQAPPPPPPLQSRRTQPNLIKELSVTAEKKATLRRVGLNSDPECTPPEARHAHSIGNSYPPIAAPRRDTGSECSTEGTPEQEKKVKVPLLPNTARMGLHPPSVQPPCPPSKTTPTAETTHGEEPPLKAPAPPPVAEKPKKKRLKSFEEVDGQDSAPQAPPIKPKEEESAAIQTIDMDALMDEAIATEPAVKKVKKKVKRKQTSEDSTADGQKEKKTKSGKPTKKKKKVVKTMEGLPREESAERDEEDTPLTHPLQDGQDLFSPPPPPALSSEDVPREPLSEVGQTDQPPLSTSISVKPVIPDLKQKHASLKRRPRGPAPPPPPPGSKTMTLGRIRDGDVIVKSRGFTLNGMEVESGRLTTDEVVTKPRSVSEALPPERVTAYPSQVGTRPRPSRKAPSRPAPSTPQGQEKARIDEGKSQADQKSEVETKRRSGSLSGSPRRPPPTVPKNVSPVIPPAHNAAAADDSSPASLKEYDGNLSRGSNESSSGKDEEASPSATTPNLPTSKPPSTPPKPASPRQPYPRQSPGESPSGRRRDAATVICKDTEDGGKELIVKPSPNSKRKLAGPLIFKMPPPPSTPPNKSKTKKPPKLAKPERFLGKKEDTGSAAAAVNAENNKKIDSESADSSFGESISDTSGLEKVCSPKSLNDTLVSNEFTNLDELLSDSQQDIVTTDFSIEENLEPVDECGEELEWNDSGLADSGIPCHDPELETMTDLHCQANSLSDNAAAALNINSNNNNNNLGADDVFDYRDLPPPVDVPPPPPGDESDEWERDSNRTGELNFDSSSSDEEVLKHRDDDGDIALDEEEGPGGVVLLNVKKVEDDVPVLPEEDKQDEQTRETGLTASNIEGTTHLVPASIPRDPSIGAQLSELDDVVSTLAELAAEVPVEAPPSPPPPPPPSLPASSHPGPLTSSTPTHKKEEHRRLSPEPPPIPQTLPPPLTPSDDDDDDFPLGPPPPLVTSEPPSLTPSPPSSPVTDRRAADTREEEEDEDGDDMANNEVLNRLKQRRIKPSSTWRRKRGSRDNSADDGGENELLEKLKERQAKYKSKAKVRREETTEPVSASDTSSIQSSSSIPGSASGMGTGSGGDNVQIQLQFLQQQVLQQQMLQLQQQFQQMQNYALQQGVSMPANLMMPGGAMLSQQSGFVTTPMAPPTGTGAQQVVMQTSAGPVLVPAASVPQMVPGQLPGVVTHPQVPVMPQGQLPQPSLQGQAIPPNITMPPSQPQQQQVVYGQGGGSQLPLPAQPPLMSTSVTTSDKTTAPASRPGNQDTLTGGPDPLVSQPGDGGTCKSSVETRPGTDSSLVTPSRLGNKRRSEDVRALVLGPLEEQFDSLMDQVRDANPTAVLKKIPEDAGDEEKEPSSSYTGMAAALAEALKQRRLHVADKRRSLGELDESAQSNSSEWQSP